jgi:hypothetical protein
MALQGYASIDRMNAKPRREEYETHRLCSYHGGGYSGIVDSRLREWATKRDIHINIFSLIRNATTTNHINSNHQDKDRTKYYRKQIVGILNQSWQ